MKKCSLLLLALLLPALVACGGTLTVGIEQTPTPDHAATATLNALMTENTRLVHQVATLTSSIPTPAPDLGKLVYLQGGDIWVKELPDGEPQRLTDDGRNLQPRWSPSGEWLAFRKDDRQVWVMRTDGRHFGPLNNGAAIGFFAWSPVNDRLAYVTSGDALRVIEVDDRDILPPVTLVPPAQPEQDTSAPMTRRIGHIAWNPDGTWIAYEWAEQPPNRPLTYQGIWKVSATDANTAVKIYDSGAPERGNAMLAGWTSDGRFLLFWQGDLQSASALADGVPLYAVPADGGSPKQLATAVLFHPDFVVPGPAGTEQVAVVTGSGPRGRIKLCKLPMYLLLAPSAIH